MSLWLGFQILRYIFDTFQGTNWQTISYAWDLLNIVFGIRNSGAQNTGVHHCLPRLVSRTGNRYCNDPACHTSVCLGWSMASLKGKNLDLSWLAHDNIIIIPSKSKLIIRLLSWYVIILDCLVWKNVSWFKNHYFWVFLTFQNLIYNSLAIKALDVWVKSFAKAST